VRSDDLGTFDDEVLAIADLCDRAGASLFEIGYLNDDPADPGWHCSARYAGTRLVVDGHLTPGAAADGLARRVLEGGGCRCGRRSTVSDVPGRCRWTRVGPKWLPGCDAPSIEMGAGQRGNLAALSQAAGSRAERRAAARRNRRGDG
jgi:hypothetical protein